MTKELSWESLELLSFKIPKKQEENTTGKDLLSACLFDAGSLSPFTNHVIHSETKGNKPHG